jgi:hypothetical protein
MAEPVRAAPDDLETMANDAIAICDGDMRVALGATILANSHEVERLSLAVPPGYTPARCRQRDERVRAGRRKIFVS